MHPLHCDPGAEASGPKNGETLHGPGFAFDAPRSLSHDGALRCAVCSESGPLSDPGWCPVVERLICDSCCTSMPLGDPDFLDTIEVMTGRKLCPQAVSDACVRCQRRSELDLRDLNQSVEGGAC